MPKKILILGVNGFIGSRLTDFLLEKTQDTIYGMDLATDKIAHCLNHPRLQVKKGDITVEKAWVEEQIQACDVVLPLVAIANPAIYVQDPLRVFELDFLANLSIVDACVKYKKRVVFPSTSEVYGMCPDPTFDEETSSLVLGPIQKPRWIYSCSKQLMDRVIHAHGLKNGLAYTLFRPFNWVGPKLDNILEPKEGGSRAFTQFLGNILRGKPISLVNGGAQRRSFTYIDDAIEALFRIVQNHNGCADQKVINIGNPHNNHSMRELAEMMLAEVKAFPKYREAAEKTQLLSVNADDYYGKGYEDVSARVPSIARAKQYLDWEPTTDVRTAIRKTLNYYLGEPDVG